MTGKSAWAARFFWTTVALLGCRRWFGLPVPCAAAWERHCDHDRRVVGLDRAGTHRRRLACLVAQRSVLGVIGRERRDESIQFELVACQSLAIREQGNEVGAIQPRRFILQFAPQLVEPCSLGPQRLLFGELFVHVPRRSRQPRASSSKRPIWASLSSSAPS
jgi:hypothetical protein